MARSSGHLGEEAGAIRRAGCEAWPEVRGTWARKPEQSGEQVGKHGQKFGALGRGSRSNLASRLGSMAKSVGRWGEQAGANGPKALTIKAWGSAPGLAAQQIIKAEGLAHPEPGHRPEAQVWPTSTSRDSHLNRKQACQPRPRVGHRCWRNLPSRSVKIRKPGFPCTTPLIFANPTSNPCPIRPNGHYRSRPKIPVLNILSNK